MRRPALFATLLALGALAMPVAADRPPAAAAGQIDRIYDIYLGGLWIAEIDVSADLGDATYRAGAAMRTKGMVARLYKASFEVAVEGAVGDGTYAPERFTVDSRNTRRTQSIEMLYEAGTPDKVLAEPEFDPDPWVIDPRAQRDVADPLSAFLDILVEQPKADLCNRQLEMFDGRKRYAITLGVPEQRETGIRCKATYQRLAGFEPRLMKLPDFDFALWFTQADGDRFRASKAVGDTSFGTIVIRLRAPDEEPT